MQWASGQTADEDAYATASGGRTSWAPSWKYNIMLEIRLRQPIYEEQIEHSCQI